MRESAPTNEPELPAPPLYVEGLTLRSFVELALRRTAFFGDAPGELYEIPILEECGARDYYQQQVDGARADLLRFAGWNFQESERQAELGYYEEMQVYYRRLKDQAMKTELYENMQEQVESWKPERKHENAKYHLLFFLGTALWEDREPSKVPEPKLLDGDHYKYYKVVDASRRMAMYQARLDGSDKYDERRTEIFRWWQDALRSLEAHVAVQNGALSGAPVSGELPEPTTVHPVETHQEPVDQPEPRPEDGTRVSMPATVIRYVDETVALAKNRVGIIKVPEIETERLYMRMMSNADLRQANPMDNERVQANIHAWLTGVLDRLPKRPYKPHIYLLTEPSTVSAFMKIAEAVVDLDTQDISPARRLIQYGDLVNLVNSLLKDRHGFDQSEAARDAMLEAVNHPDFTRGYKKLVTRIDAVGRSDIDMLLATTLDPLVMDNYVDAKGVRVFEPPYGDKNKGLKWDPPKSGRFIESCLESWAKDGFGRLGLELKHTGELIGYCGLAQLDYLPDPRVGRPGELPIAGSAPGKPPIELSFRIRSGEWSKGLANEAARATFKWGFDDFGLEVIYASAVTTNQNSRRALTRLGMSEAGIYHYRSEITENDADWMEHRITYDEWQRMQATEGRGRKG